MNTLSLKKKFLLIGFSCLAFLLSTQAQNSYITIRGTVKDINNHKELMYVNVSVPEQNLGTVTNEDGEFLLKIQDSIPQRKLIFSHVGYKNQVIAFSDHDVTNAQIFLEPAIRSLDEVIIHARGPEWILSEAMKRIPKNYSEEPSNLLGFYRETAKKGRHYIRITEAIVNLYKTSYKYGINNDKVQVFKGRKLLSEKPSDTLAIKLLGGPNLSLQIDIAKNRELLLDKNLFEYYKFKLETPIYINNKLHYVIDFAPKVLMPYALYHGKLYIDKEMMAISRAEFFLDLDDRDKATKAILRKKPLGLRFKPKEVAYIVTYKQVKEKTYLSYIRNELRFVCDWKRKLFGTRYNVVSEMVVTAKQDTTKGISWRKSFKPYHSLSDKVENFTDLKFWKDYNIIKPSESLEKAVGRLKKQRD